MIVICLAGESSRFFNEGYEIVKYKLPIGKYNSVIEGILDFIPRSEKILVILNNKYSDKYFISSLLQFMNFTSFEIVEINSTKGQIESVYNGLSAASSFINYSDVLTIYNGDTIRKINNWSHFEGDGCLEVFKSSGNHWSFVDKLGAVSLVKEKERISNLCSSGLYYFSSVKLFIDFYNEYINFEDGELFVAPMYNLLIKNNFDVKSVISSKSKFIFCGTPKEYERSQLKFIGN